MDIESASESKTSSGCWAVAGKLKDRAAETVKKAKKIGQDDPRKIIHPLKVGLALTLVSLLYHVGPLYDGFGSAAIWAVITVVVVFEFTVGATLSKCFNRGLATFLGSALGLGATYLAGLFGQKGQPILLGFVVYVIAAASTFTRFFPNIKSKYDYGVLIFILTFSMVAVSGSRVEDMIELAHERLSTIILGVAVCMVISIFIFPAWAGEDLHTMLALNLEKLGISLEGVAGEYFKLCGDGDSGVDKSFLQAYKTVFNSKFSEEALANFAWWEPCHGKFRFRHPWRQYLKLGGIARQCAYRIEVLDGYLNSEIGVQSEFEASIKEACRNMSSECGKALKELSMSIKTMKQPLSALTHLDNSKLGIDEVKAVLEAASLDHADLLKVMPAVTIASILIDIIKCVEDIADSVHELSRLAFFKPHMLHKGSVAPVGDSNSGGGGVGAGDADHVVIMVVETTSVDSLEERHPQALKRNQLVE